LIGRQKPVSSNKNNNGTAYSPASKTPIIIRERIEPDSIYNTYTNIISNNNNTSSYQTVPSSLSTNEQYNDPNISSTSTSTSSLTTNQQNQSPLQSTSPSSTSSTSSSNTSSINNSTNVNNNNENPTISTERFNSSIKITSFNQIIQRKQEQDQQKLQSAVNSGMIYGTNIIQINNESKNLTPSNI
jgi:hypothetical protein